MARPEQYSCSITKAFDCAGVKKLVKEGRIGEDPEVAQFPTNSDLPMIRPLLA